MFAAGGYSYPSGHLTASFILTTVLGIFFPEKQQALLDRAAQVAQSRVDAGVHYPAGIKQGKMRGKSTATAIIATPEFQADKPEGFTELRRQ